MKQVSETYLGDGLYVSCDGWTVKLRAPRDIDHYVYLEDWVLEAFLQWLKLEGIIKDGEKDGPERGVE